MKFKRTLIWAGVLVALAAFVYFYEIKGGEKRERAAEQANKIFVLNKEAVQKLTLRSDQKTIVCQRTEQGWQLIQPVDAPGDETAIQGVINSLERAQMERVVDETGENLADFALDPPQVTLELEYENAPKQILHLGQRNPTRTSVYAKKEGDKRVFLTLSSLLTQAQKEIFDLRDKRLLTFDEDQVNGLMLQRDRHTIQVHKGPQGWLLEKPIQGSGDESAIQALLGQLKTARINSFVEEKPEDLAQYGLHKPKLAITLTLGSEKAQKRLYIGKEKDDQYYARDESLDPVFLISGDVVKEVDKTPFDLRDKLILHFPRGQVDRVELKSPDWTIICQKDTADQWQLVAPESSAAKNWKVASILSSLSTLKAECFVEENPQDLAKYGLSNPSLEAILKDQGRDLAVLHLGIEKGEQVYASNETGAPVTLVAQRIVGTLSPQLEDLVEEEVPEEQ
jgi:hypothetical protein